MPCLALLWWGVSQKSIYTNRIQMGKKAQSERRRLLRSAHCIWCLTYSVFQKTHCCRATAARRRTSKTYAHQSSGSRAWTALNGLDVVELMSLDNVKSVNLWRSSRHVGLVARLSQQHRIGKDPFTRGPPSQCYFGTRGKSYYSHLLY